MWGLHSVTAAGAGLGSTFSRGASRCETIDFCLHVQSRTASDRGVKFYLIVPPSHSNSIVSLYFLSIENKIINELKKQHSVYLLLSRLQKQTR